MTTNMIDRITSLYIELLDCCNAYCPYCYNNSGATKSSLINKEDIKKLLEHCPMNINAISLSGGEPLLHPDFFSILHMITEREYQTQIITNGTLITREIATKLKEYSPIVRISFDSLNAKTYNFRKGKDLFSAAIRGILNMREVEYSKLSVRINVDYDNIDEIEQMLETLEKWGVGEVYLSLITSAGRGNREIHLSQSNSPHRIQHLCELRDRFSTESFRVMYQGGVCIMCPYSFEGTHAMPISLLINPAGSVYPCLMLDSSEYCLGNIHQETLNEILNSKRFSEFCKMSATRCESIEECGKCQYKRLCGGGCPALALQKKGNYYSTDGDCAARRESIMLAIRNRKPSKVYKD